MRPSGRGSRFCSRSTAPACSSEIRVVIWCFRIRTTLKLTSSPTRPRTRRSRTDTFASGAEIKTSRPDGSPEPGKPTDAKLAQGRLPWETSFAPSYVVGSVPMRNEYSHVVQAVKNIGAGEGNRTLVFSLEGVSQRYQPTSPNVIYAHTSTSYAEASLH